MTGHIATKATIIIVPPHLTRQWESEVRKFTKARFEVVTLHTASNLNSLKVQEVMDADLSEYVDVQLYPGVGEGQKVGQADGVMVLKAWVERLNRDDVRDAKCVEVKRESGHAFDFWYVPSFIP